VNQPTFKMLAQQDVFRAVPVNPIHRAVEYEFTAVFISVHSYTRARYVTLDIRYGSRHPVDGMILIDDPLTIFIELCTANHFIPVRKNMHSSIDSRAYKIEEFPGLMHHRLKEAIVLLPKTPRPVIVLPELFVDQQDLF
jgi:hypothetical protein